MAGQTAGPNGLTFFVDTQGFPGGFLYISFKEGILEFKGTGKVK